MAKGTMAKVHVMIPRIFHALVLAYSMFVVGYWMTMTIPAGKKANMPNLNDNGWQYLTIWNMWFQGSFFVICVLDDFLQSCTQQKFMVFAKERLASVRDTLFQSLTLPLSMCVLTIFWTVYAYDRELIYPAEMDTVIPFWFNHLFHTAVVFFPWAEMLICQRRFDKVKLRFCFGMAVMAIYNVIVIASAYWQGYWTYPLLGVMTPVQRGLFFAILYGTYMTTYIVGYKANEKICEESELNSCEMKGIEPSFSLHSQARI